MSSNFWRRTAILSSYALAMAYLESATVTYLQRALAISPGVLFPIRNHNSLGSLASIEVGREVATLIMLITVGWFVGRSALERFAWVAVAFGIWDIGYYFFLWLFIGWPKSLGTYDLLFLLPVPWVGPVWAPLVVSVALIGFGVQLARRFQVDVAVRVTRRDAALLSLGGATVILSFTLHFRAILDGAIPHSFAWPLFILGMLLGILGAIPLARASKADS